MARRGWGVAAAFGAALCAASAHAADEMAVYMKNMTERSVAVELYAQDRRFVWPGGDQVYLLEKGEKKSVPIACRPAERICWGAWRYGNDRFWWGTGPDNGRACEECCMICAPKTTETVEIGP
ncbi:MAG: hypothetical protein KF914_17580 [Rhizobiaceae bacterium]|nr:hypothetical protein [Rhizobiaceae bacterium]